MARKNFIKQIREEKGMTATELAERIGKNRATVYRYENGNIENVPSVVIEQIAEVLGTTAIELLGYSTEESNIRKEFISLFDELPAEHQELIVAQIKGILSK